jgi:phosphatidylserine synthase
MLGLYTNYTIYISAKVPFPVPAGIAGIVLLWRRRDRIRSAHLAGLFGALALYLVSILWATNIEFLPRRSNGLIQLSYSIIIGYALFLTLTQGTRRQIRRLFLGFALVILVGCLLETYAGLRPLSE